MSESKSLLSIENVSNEYAGTNLTIFRKDRTQKVLNQISFEIGNNEFFGLVGESGCGKSTLGKAILGLIDFSGKITIDGESRTKTNKKKLASKVQAVFQDPLSALNPRKTIGFTLEEPLKIHGIGKKEDRSKRINEILELVGLDSTYRDRYPDELSGGQRQRICIGAALMLEPKLIVADEAISALDVSVGSQILNLLQDIHEKFSLSLLFISHNLNVVYYLCERIAVMYGGNVVEIGEAKEVYEHPRHPYTKLLLSAIPNIDTSEWKQEVKHLQEETEKYLDDTAGCCFQRRCTYVCEICRTLEPEFLDTAEKGQYSHFVSCHLIKNKEGKI